MPNWCDNRLTIWGSKKDIKNFKEKAKSQDPKQKTDLMLNNFVPLPNELTNTIADFAKKPYEQKLIKKYGAEDWYHWHIKNWGTKWDIEAELIDDQEYYLEYTFDSAWAPPTEWLEKVTKMYPNMDFTLHYDEPGACFKGVARGKEGKYKDQCIEY